MLVDEKLQVETTCSRRSCVGFSAALMLVALAHSVLTLRRLPSAAASPEAAAQEREGQELTFECRVVDRTTGKGIAGARVLVERIVCSPAPDQHHEVMARTEHVTDGNGRWRAVFPPDQVSDRRLYVQVSVTHPGDGSLMQVGYGLAMIQKNPGLGVRPFFEEVKPRPAKPVTGVLRTPRGEPVAGACIIACSQTTDKLARHEPGSRVDTTSDAERRFRFMAVTPGKAEHVPAARGDGNLHRPGQGLPAPEDPDRGPRRGGPQGSEPGASAE